MLPQTLGEHLPDVRGNGLWRSGFCQHPSLFAVHLFPKIMNGMGYGKLG